MASTESTLTGPIEFVRHRSSNPSVNTVKSAVTAIATFVVIAVTLAACGDSPASSSQDRSEVLSAGQVAERYGYDPGTATLTPVFAIIPEYKDPMDGYARDLRAQECLKGVVAYTPVMPNLNNPLYDERTGQGKFDVDIAREWGYPYLHSLPGPDSAVPDDVNITPEINEKMIQCGKETDKILGQPPFSLPRSIEQAGWDVAGWDPAALDPTIADAQMKWKACMIPAGIIDLPEDPSEMPPASVVQPPQDGIADVAAPPATAREKDVAVLDAQCRESSGFDQAEFQARVNAELAAIGRDVDGFEAARKAYQEYDKRVQSLLNQFS